MRDYVKPYISLLEDFLKEKNKSAEIILIGGLAMSFYGSPRYTIDMDGEIKFIKPLNALSESLSLIKNQQ